MEKKLDNSKNGGKESNPLGQFVETADSTGMVTDDELQDSLEDFDMDFETDEEGNFITTSDDEPDIPEEGEQDGEDDESPDDESEEEQDEEEPVQEQVIDKPAKKKLTPAEVKLIALKKENQRLAKEKAELEARMQEKQQKQLFQDLTQQFVDQGYDEETAKSKASEELRQRQLEERVELLDFRESNADVLARYPQAKENIRVIMQKAKAADLTAEQVCMALYGKAIPAYEERALQAAKGNSTREVKSDNVATATIEAKATESKDRLSPQEQKEKRMLERMFNRGEELTVAEYKKYRRR